MQEIGVESEVLVNLFDELPNFEYESEDDMTMKISDHHSDEEHLDKVLIQEHKCATLIQMIRSPRRIHFKLRLSYSAHF